MFRLAPLACALMVWLHAEGASALAGCAAARTYGANTSGFFVSAVFARVARGEVTVADAHRSLDRMLASYVLRGNASDDERLCLYEGMWRGLVNQLAVAYARVGLSCLERTTLASHARALLGSVLSALEDPSRLDVASAIEVFGYQGEGSSGGPPCEPAPVEVCVEVLQSALPRPPDDVVEQVAALVCAAALQPDAGAPDGG
jgi:hypothetical protein